MPEISRFFGIVIRMYFDDHQPPHCHVEYGDCQALVDINTLAILSGRLPPRAVGLVIEWATRHQKDLHDCWERAQHQLPPGRIAPLE